MLMTKIVIPEVRSSNGLTWDKKIKASEGLCSFLEGVSRDKTSLTFIGSAFFSS